MPLFWLAGAFLLGLLLGRVIPMDWPIWAGWVAVLCLAALFERRLLGGWRYYPDWRRVAHLPLAVVLAFVGLGAVRYVSAQPHWNASNLAWYIGQGKAYLVGTVQQPPQASEATTTLVLSVEQLAPLVDGQPGEPLPVSGLLRVSLPLNPDLRYGDRLQLQGELEKPGGGGATYFSDNLARQGIFAEMNYPAVRLVGQDAGNWFFTRLYEFRALADRTLANLLPQPESALLAGVLLGDDSSFPDDVSRDFRTTGITHLIAVSGFNVAIVSGLLMKTLGRLLRARFAIPLAALAIAGYTLLTGAPPSVVRAAIMGGIGLLAPPLGRQQVGLNSLVFTAGLMCLFSPGLPWDLSFQLSFGATLGLVLFAEPFQQGFVRLASRRLPVEFAQRLGGPVGEYVLFTFAAQLFTLPMTAVTFQNVSLVSLLANPLVLPAQPPAMILGGAALLAGLVFFPLGQLLAWLCWPLLAYTIHVAQLLAQVQYSIVRLGIFSPVVIALYFCAVLAPKLPPLRRWLGSLMKPSIGILLAGLLAAGLWRVALSAPDGRLHLDVLNLPDGPAMLVRSPAGQAWLVNGSSDAAQLQSAVAQRLSPFTTRLDGLVVTNRQAPVLQGLDSFINRYPPHLLAMTAHLNDTKTRDRLLGDLAEQGVRPTPLDPSPAFDLGGGCSLRVLQDRQDGTPIWLAWDRFSILQPGGLALGDLPEDLPEQVSLLLLTPEDLALAAPGEWLARFNPQSVLFMGGAPPDMPGWLALDGYDWLSIQTDGSQMWVEGHSR